MSGARGEKYRVVTEGHEQGTIQSYLDLDLVSNLLGKIFEISEFYNIKKGAVLDN